MKAKAKRILITTECHEVVIIRVADGNASDLEKSRYNGMLRENGFLKDSHGLIPPLRGGRVWSRQDQTLQEKDYE
jgi:hypothetical protein